MSAVTRYSCLAAGLAFAAFAAGNVQAGKPMNVLEKKAAAEAMARAHQQAAASKQVARKGAAPATISAPGGGTGSEVPEDLHNYLHAQIDAKGNVRIVETDGHTAPAKQEANDE